MKTTMNKQFLEKAIELATENVTSNNGGPFGAVVTKDDTIIATGVNCVTTHNDPTAHAEIVAIRAACKKLNHFQLTDCIIYSSCEPCPMCLGALYWARPRALYFASSRHDAATAGFDDSFIYKEIPLAVHERSITTEHVALATHLTPFTAWQKNQKKTNY